MSPARLAVRAVVVSDGQTARLPTVLDAVLAQDPAPDSVELVMVGGAAAPTPLPSASVTVHEVDAHDFSTAVNAAVAAYDAAPGELLWLLHDDSAPQPGALALQVATARKRHRAGIVGAAQVQWDDTTRLVSIGATSTRFGARRLNLVEEGDVDQGQYDSLDDVLAVSIAGALVRRELWDHLGGLDPAYRGWSDSIDLCRRAWRAEWDVVVVPRARIAHAQDRLHGVRGPHSNRRSTYGPRRASEWFHALVYAPWWMVLPLILGSMVSSAGRVLLRIAQNDPRMAFADAAVPARLLVRLPQVVSSRRRVARSGLRGKAARAVERPLLASPRQVRHETRSREWGAYESWRASTVPPELIRGELAVAARRRRVTLAAVLAVTIGASVLRHPDWVSGIVSGRMLASGQLGVTDTGWHDLWERGLGGWTEQALGAPSIDGGLSLLLLPLALVPGGLAVGFALIVAFAPVWSALGVWAAAGTLTRSRTVRALAAVTYALAPVAVSAGDDARFSAVVVHLALPWVVFGVVRAGGWHLGERIGDGEEFPGRPSASPSAAAGAAAMLAIVVIAAPVLLIPALLAVAVVGACAGPMRVRMWAVGLPALVVGLPGLLAAVMQGTFTADAWSVLTREPGPSISSSSSALDTLVSGVPSTAPAWLTWTSSAVIPLALGFVVLATVVGRSWVRSTVGMAMVIGGVVIAAASTSTSMSPDDGLGTAMANGWAGPGLSVVLVGAVVAIGAASRGAWDRGAGRPRAAGRAVQLVAACAAGLIVAGHTVAVAWPDSEREGAQSVSKDVIPLVAALEIEQPTRQRVLVLSDSGDAISAALMSTDGTEVLSTAGELVGQGRPAARTTGVRAVGFDSLTTVIAGVVGGSPEAPQGLADWGIGVVVAAPGADRAVSALAQSDALQLLGSSDRGTTWRVARPGSDVPVSRAWVEDSEGPVTAVEMGRSGGSVDLEEPVTGTVVLANSADQAWTATLNGRALEPVEDDLGRAAFAVDGSGTLRLAYDDAPHRVWWWVSLIAVAWACIGSIPLPTRLFRETRA
ncbi:glycosyltransferase [Demequina globuliformis]|uniref:glycosyltransferase n=1 Tax=Demequina globuliformis TaxID=676202 RepID=UPI000A05AF96|nr:glycosyltransferase [Demequina globuliformis]